MLGQPEIQHLHAAVARHHDVLRLQIAVDDPQRVRRRDPLGRLRGDIEQPAQRQRPAVDDGPEGFALHQLRDDVGLPVVLADIVDRDDVGMIERGERPGFLLEPLPAHGIARDVRRQDLDGDGPVQPLIARPPDFAHAAFAELIENFVAAQFAAGHGALVILRRRGPLKIGGTLHENKRLARYFRQSLRETSPAAPRWSRPPRPPAAAPGRTSRRADGGSTARRWSSSGSPCRARGRSGRGSR